MGIAQFPHPSPPSRHSTGPTACSGVGCSCCASVGHSVHHGMLKMSHLCTAAAGHSTNSNGTAYNGKCGRTRPGRPLLRSVRQLPHMHACYACDSGCSCRRSPVNHQDTVAGGYALGLRHVVENGRQKGAENRSPPPPAPRAAPILVLPREESPSKGERSNWRSNSPISTPGNTFEGG